MLASFTVDIAADEFNFGPTSMGLSLREAIFLANTDGGSDNAQDDIITFAPALAGQTITLTTNDADDSNADLDLIDTTGSITIMGLGANQLTISGNNAVRVFEVRAGVTAEISSLTITGGRHDFGAGIANLGNLTVTEAVVSGNTATTQGGGIENEGTLIVDDATIRLNSAPTGGGIRNLTGATATVQNGSVVSENSASINGGGIHNLGTLTVDNATVSTNVAISGAGIFNVNAGTATIQNGAMISENAASSAGGGIFNQADLTVDTNSTISMNSANNGGGINNGANGTATIQGGAMITGNSAADAGGGINNFGSLTVDGSTIASNTAGSGGGGIHNSDGTVTISSADLLNNTASGDSATQGGGGIFNNGGTVNVTTSTISNNTADASHGGGVFNDGTLNATNSMISSNDSFGDGAGVFNEGDVELTQVTVSGNVSGTNGGGISTETGSVTINNTTIANNEATGEGGGINHDDSGTVTLNSTLIATNTFGTGTNDVFGSVGGTFNLIGVDTGLTGITNGVDNNQVGAAMNPIDPRLSPLADNGGPTLTHAILPDSPALNAGDNPLSLTADQRGGPFVRVFGSQTDIGAFELQSVNGGGNDIVVTAPGPGVPGILRIVNAITQDDLFPALSIEPYPGFLGGIRVAVGDVSGDGTPDIITVPGRGGGPHVKVFSGQSGAEIRSFFAFGAGFLGGVFVAAGDLNGDDQADIIVGADAGGGPHIRAFSGATGSELFSFFAFGAGFRGGVRVATGDLSGDGIPDIITAAGPGGGPHVKVFDGQTGGLIAGPLGSFFAYAAGFRGGVFVAAGDVSGDGRIDLITAPGAGGGPHVKVFDGTDGSVFLQFFAYAAGFTGGVRVAASDITGDGRADILTAPGPGLEPNARAFNAATGDLIRDVPAADSQFAGGIFIAGSVNLESSGSPLRLAEGFIANDSAETLTLAQAGPVFEAALARLEAAGLSANVTSTLSTLTVEIRDLSGNHLGEALPGLILLDDDAAGTGWFVDVTPQADEEFDSATFAAVTSEARQGVDLLTVLLHELGHQLGLDDASAGINPANLMAETLGPGQRRLPSSKIWNACFLIRICWSPSSVRNRIKTNLSNSKDIRAGSREL